MKLVTYLLSAENALRPTVLAHPDVKRVVQLKKDELNRWPDARPDVWAFLVSAGETTAPQAAQTMAKDQYHQLLRKLDLLLYPMAFHYYLEECIATQIADQPGEKEKLDKRLAELGFSLPVLSK